MVIVLTAQTLIIEPPSIYKSETNKNGRGPVECYVSDSVDESTGIAESIPHPTKWSAKSTPVNLDKKRTDGKGKKLRIGSKNKNIHVSQSCEKDFCTESCLKHQVKTQTGKKTYRCNVCAK